MLKPEGLEAVYSMEINRCLYEEIRIKETWDTNGIPVHSDRYEEGYLWSELYGQSNAEPFDKWAFNHHMSVLGGTGTLESFFEKHFSQEKIRRMWLNYLYPGDWSGISQQEYWKTDPRINWLYYKNKFDAVFPMLCEMGKTKLTFKLEGSLNDVRKIEFSYATGYEGALYVDGRHLINIGFYDERYDHQKKPSPLEIGRPERINGKPLVMLYGVHSFSDLLQGLEMAADKALFYDEQAPGKGGRIIYKIDTLFRDAIIANQTELSEEELLLKGAQKLKQPEIRGRRIGQFYWNYDPSVDTLGGYAGQAFYPDTYRLTKSAVDGEDTEQEYEYYMVFDGLTDLNGWYPLDRFVWEDDPEPTDADKLRRIILDFNIGKLQQ